MKYNTVFGAAAMALVIVATSGSEASAATIRGGFDTNTLAPNDDGSTGLVSIGFTANFFGVSNTQLYVNNNGNVTFDAPLPTFTPFDLTSTGRQIIAPFFADVDTRGPGEAVTYGTGTVDSRDAFGVNWIDVGFFEQNEPLNSFQLVLVDRSDTGAGNFDIEFNYGTINWEAGTASNGDPNGLGGDSARAGFSNGTEDPGTFFEIEGSAVNGAFLDGGPNALISSSNIDEPGRYLFESRGGAVDPGAPSVVPLPAAAWFLLGGLGALGMVGRRRKV